MEDDPVLISIQERTTYPRITSHNRVNSIHHVEKKKDLQMQSSCSCDGQEGDGPEVTGRSEGIGRVEYIDRYLLRFEKTC